MSAHVSPACTIFVVNFARCANILHVPHSDISDPIGTNPSFLFLVSFSSLPLLFQPQARWGRCRTSYLLQDGKTPPVAWDGGDEGCARLSPGQWWALGAWRSLAIGRYMLKEMVFQRLVKIPVPHPRREPPARPCCVLASGSAWREPAPPPPKGTSAAPQALH